MKDSRLQLCMFYGFRTSIRVDEEGFIFEGKHQKRFNAYARVLFILKSIWSKICSLFGVEFSPELQASLVVIRRCE